MCWRYCKTFYFIWKVHACQFYYSLKIPSFKCPPPLLTVACILATLPHWSCRIRSIVLVMLTLWGCGYQWIVDFWHRPATSEKSYKKNWKILVAKFTSPLREITGNCCHRMPIVPTSSDRRDVLGRSAIPTTYRSLVIVNRTTCLEFGH